jgi:regulator of protease activity HflC (stomatin/prohibitin superfamily)
MFDRLVDLIIQFANLFVPWAVVDEYEGGVILTLGRPRKPPRWLRWIRKSPVVGPGFYFRVPFGAELVLVTNVVTAIDDLIPQTLVTADGKTVVISIILTWRIERSRVDAFLLKVETAKQALRNAAVEEVSEYVRTSTYPELLEADVSLDLLDPIQKKASKYGIVVEEVGLSDFAPVPTIRLLGFEQGRM